MKAARQASFVTTVRERCKSCNTCVRECPAHAIRMRDGRAEVVAERCIACGNCVRVCSQHAQVVQDTTEEVLALLEGEAPVAALVAPSFSASFPDMNARELVGMVRALGFAYVNEVAFGAELVADRYRDLLSAPNGKRWITRSCPAVVEYVRRYHPALTESLAPVVSPMVAAARSLRAMHGPKLRIVYFGPCIARKVEAGDAGLKGEINAASTFVGLRLLWGLRHVTLKRSKPSDFDPPRSRFGGIAALSRGLLQLAGIAEDFAKGDVVVASGRERFTGALREFGSNMTDVRVLDLLACQGCIMGTAMTTDAPLYQRRYRISHYVQANSHGDGESWERNVAHFSGLNLERRFRADDQRGETPSSEELQSILTQLGKRSPADELNCGACGYATCREHAAAIHLGLAERRMCLPHAVEELRTTVTELTESHAELSQVEAALARTQESLNTEIFAAGLAHELNNPLGVILMYINLLLEEGSLEGKAADNLTQAAEQVNYCRRIVGDLLHFAREHSLTPKRVDFREVVETALQASWIPDSVKVRIEQDAAPPRVEVDVDHMVELLRVLVENACDAMSKGGTVVIRIAEACGGGVDLTVADTGAGIAPGDLDKAFEPFFSTKSHGQGSGLGLANAQRIVRAHGGEIRIESQPGKGCSVRVRIPNGYGDGEFKVQNGKIEP